MVFLVQEKIKKIERLLYRLVRTMVIAPNYLGDGLTSFIELK